MVRNFLPLRSSANDNTSAAASDASSVRSAASSTWTAISTTPTVADASVSSDDNSLSLSLHPLIDQDGLIVKVKPPTAPDEPIAHVPCDIVLVIDVSGSMNDSASIPANANEAAEEHGLSVLDLVKHAARTIFSTMDAGDRLGIVTFSREARVWQKLIPMDEAGKQEAEKHISTFFASGATNLWHGILEAIKLFKGAGEINCGRVPAIMILTDGEPNYMCPQQGYVPKLQNMEQLPASLHTFGFGYSLRSGLLKAIAEVGNGNYAFIPDAGMIGTAFVNALANLQSTFATNAVLKLTYPAAIEIQETTGQSINRQEVITLPDEPGEPTQLSISLGNIQYGQTRDIYLKLTGAKGNVKSDQLDILGTLEYSRMTGISFKEQAHQDLTISTNLSDSEIAYHISRSQLCEFLSSLLMKRSDGEYQAVEFDQAGRLAELKSLIASIPAQKFASDPSNGSLLEDLAGQTPKGQISVALERKDYYRKWGVHYLPSLLNAHMRQICNTFKDSGPLQYGSKSPLFISCRNKLDDAFDNLPPPKPSHRSKASHGSRVNMSHYNNARGVCFAAFTLLDLACGKTIPIEQVRRGTEVLTPSGSKRVDMVLRTPVVQEPMCRVGELLVTPWHPISLDQGENWTFPAYTTTTCLTYTGEIYSLLLEPDPRPDSHAVSISSGILGVTLGHGILSGSDTRAHAFFGDYSKVVQSLKDIGVSNETGIAIGNGVRRDLETGLVTRFKRGGEVDQEAQRCGSPGVYQAEMHTAAYAGGDDSSWLSVH